MSDESLEKLVNYLCGRSNTVSTRRLIENIVTWVVMQSMDKEDTISALMCMLDGISVSRRELERLITI